MTQRSNSKGKDQGSWQVDGISAEAIAAATTAAEQAGVDLAVWLSRLIRDTAERERQSRAAARHAGNK